jgi:uroporphyrin-III C-methyltransferase
MLKIVSIVGAGPGDPELLTLKAARLLKEAQAVVYDRLVPQAILNMIAPAAEKFFAGKSCKHHAMEQEEINALLVTLAERGLKVVRLKGGNPLVFGRGGEEAEYLADKGIACEIVPGISAASGCAAGNKIPLTHRGLSKGVQYISGHYKDPEHEIDWPRVTDPDTTLVVYMGLANIGIIARKLVEHGLPPDFPLAAVENGTLENGRVVISTLQHAADDISKAGFEPPVLIIIGKVVTLYGKLNVK